MKIELAALAIPLAFSFDRKVAFYKMWSFILPAILLNALFFIGLDIFFTSEGAWGFNPDYHSIIIIAGLPLEEALFFIIIPYCCLFIHYVFIAYLPNTSLSNKITRLVSILSITIFLVWGLSDISRSYTLVYTILCVTSIVIAWIFNKQTLSKYYITFLIMFIPFMITNSILTGTFIGDGVFWYKASEISGMKILSIPVEDALFTFCMILLTILTAEYFRKLQKK
ncbi:MAG TPA: lycopene cyclase domain-containing protein [Bacteroidales bacterium]|nr:lycopene cyclase domain-containing protein [Bacteroidales bacterium]